MNAWRWTLVVLCLAAPPVAYRLPGAWPWLAFAVGYGLAAALAARALAQDDLFVDLLRPRAGDVAFGVGTATALYLALYGFVLYVAAPQPFLRLCTFGGGVVGRPEVRGLGVVVEWVRNQACDAFAHAAGLRGPVRGVATVLIAAAEELAWRGGVQQGLAERFGTTRGYVLAAVLYGAAHLSTGNFALVFLALAGGFAWGALYRYRGRLAPALISHCVFSWFFVYNMPLFGFRAS